MGTGAVVLAGLVRPLVAPKAAHAIAAPAVQVENTPFAPVPNLDVERNARIRYQSTGVCTGGIVQCLVILTAAPTGYRLIAERVAVFGFGYVGSTPRPGA